MTETEASPPEPETEARSVPYFVGYWRVELAGDVPSEGARDVLVTGTVLHFDVGGRWGYVSEVDGERHAESGDWRLDVIEGEQRTVVTRAVSGRGRELTLTPIDGDTLALVSADGGTATLHRTPRVLPTVEEIAAAEASLAGVWVLQASAITLTGVDPTESIFIGLALRSLEITLDYRPDGTFVGQNNMYSSSPDPAGTWSIRDIVDDRYVMELLDEGDVEPTITEYIIVTPDRFIIESVDVGTVHMPFYRRPPSH